MLPKCCTFWPKQQISLKIIPLPTVRHTWRKPFACCFLCGQISGAMTVYLLEYYFQQNEISDWKKSFKSRRKCENTWPITPCVRVFSGFSSYIRFVASLLLWSFDFEVFRAKIEWQNATKRFGFEFLHNYVPIFQLECRFFISVNPDTFIEEKPSTTVRSFVRISKNFTNFLTSNYSDDRQFKFLELEIRHFSFFFEKMSSH